MLTTVLCARRLLSATLPDLISTLNLRDADSWAKWSRSGVRCAHAAVSVCDMRSRAATPEREFPASVGRLQSFQRVLAIQVCVSFETSWVVLVLSRCVQVLRPDRLMTALEVFVCEAMGCPSVNPPPSSFSRVYDVCCTYQSCLLTSFAVAGIRRKLLQRLRCVAFCECGGRASCVAVLRCL